MFQMKEQDKSPEEELSEVEISNLPDKVFKVMIIKMFKELWKRLNEQSEKLEIFNRVRKYKEEPKTLENYNKM